jgi:hypothetical protein
MHLTLHQTIPRKANEACGAILKFKCDNVQAQRILDTLKRQGVIERADVQRYDPTYGGPVWYIP